MRYIRYLFVAILGICLLVIALANLGTVTLHLLPEGVVSFVGTSPQVELPLFIVILGGILAGLLIGFVWEWLREHKHRAVAVTERRERVRLEREVDRLKGPAPKGGDDILAILDKSAAAR